VEILGPVLVSGLTTGALYALATLGLSLVWGVLGMLNMAHGAMLTLGGYAAYAAVVAAGLPAPVGVLAAVLAGAAAGVLIHVLIARPLVRRSPETFETAVMIATFGAAIALQNTILAVAGGQPLGQPLSLSGSVQLGPLVAPWQSLLIMGVSIALMVAVALYLARTRGGRAIRAVSQNREAAALMGVPAEAVYLRVLALSGALAGACGLLVSSLTQLSPTLGSEPMLKAFIMCVVAGLGNIPGAIVASFALAMIEALVQYHFGARWGFPVLLGIVILVLIWRPTGLFGRATVQRL
jgi:branched-chain amino acid transport system permease protein